MNELKVFLKKILQRETVDEIEKLVFSAAQSKIYLCFPNHPSEQRNLHFFISVGNKEELKAPGISNLSMAITDTFDYDHTADKGADIVIKYSKLLKEGSEKELYKDMILLTRENLENGSLQNFLAVCYPQYVTLQQNRSSGEKDSSEENIDRSVQRITAYIASDPQLQESFKTVENWEKTIQGLATALKPQPSVNSSFDKK